MDQRDHGKQEVTSDLGQIELGWENEEAAAAAAAAEDRQDDSLSVWTSAWWTCDDSRIA